MKNNKIDLVVKLGLIIMLLLCLLAMPYGYYQIVRVSSFVVLGFLAYREYQKKNIGLFLIFIIGAVLFNPIVKLNLGRHIWQMVDVAFSIILLVSIFKNIRSFSTKN